MGDVNWPPATLAVPLQEAKVLATQPPRPAVPTSTPRGARSRAAVAAAKSAAAGGEETQAAGAAAAVVSAPAEIGSIRHHSGFMGQRLGPVACLAFHPTQLLLAVGATDNCISLIGMK